MSNDNRSMEQVVAKFLRQNPDFLEREPALLKDMQLSHSSGPAVSLIEKQVQYLRNENQALQQRLNQLIQVASDNEKLMNRLHQLTLELMVMQNLPAFFDLLTESLMQEFKADIINITLFDIEVEAGPKTPIHTTRRDDPEQEAFSAQLEKGVSTCGRLSSDKRDYLFGARAQSVQSTALVPLGDYGMLTIGSSDPARFYPGMGTLFLDLLAKVVVSRLAIEEPAKQRRIA